MYPHLGLNPNFPCLRCDVTLDNMDWSVVPNDQTCDPSLQQEWQNLASQACQHSHVCQDGICVGQPYSCPPLQGCEGPTEAFPHVCDLTGPGSNTGGCQVQQMASGTVCAPQVHGCMRAAACTGNSGSCPHQVELPGIIFQDPGKAMSPVLPSGDAISLESPVVPSNTDITVRYTNFRTECGELRLRQAVIPEGACSLSRVSDRLGGFGSDFEAPPRGGFEMLVTPSDAPMVLLHASSFANVVAIESDSSTLANVPLGEAGDLSRAVGRGFEATGVADAFLDIELRREHAVNLHQVVVADTAGVETTFTFPAVQVPNAWLVVSGQAQATPSPGFDWSAVATMRFVRDGHVAFDVSDGTQLFSVRRVTLRTRAQAPPCATAEVLPSVPEGDGSTPAVAVDGGSAEVTLMHADTPRPMDITALYDLPRNEFVPGVHLVLDVAIGVTVLDASGLEDGDTDATVSEVHLVTASGATIVAPVLSINEVTYDTNGAAWAHIVSPLRPGTLPASRTDTSFAAITGVRVGISTGSPLVAVATARIRNVYVTKTLLCAHALSSNVNGAVELFVESTAEPAVQLTPDQPGSPELKSVQWGSPTIAGPTFDFDLSTLFDEECQCFRHAVLVMDLTLPAPSEAVTRLDLLDIGTGNGLRLDMAGASVQHRAPTSATPKRRLRLALDGPHAVVVGPISNWASINALRLHRAVTARDDAAFTLHSLHVERTTVPCISSTALPLPGTVPPSGVIVSHDMPSTLAVGDALGRLSQASVDASSQSSQAGVWTDGGVSGDDSYSAAAVVPNARGEPLLVAVGTTTGTSDTTFAGQPVGLAAGAIVAARHARTAAGVWAIELGAGITASDVVGAATSSLRPSLRRLASDFPHIDATASGNAAHAENGGSARRLASGEVTDGLACPAGYIPAASNPGKCYTVLTGSVARTWLDAHHTCAVVTGGRGTLAHPTSVAEQAQLLNLANGANPWVGLRRVYAELVWDDGSYGTPAEVYRQTYIHGCFHMTNLGVEEADCGWQMAVACEWRADWFDSCPAKWRSIGSSCVHLVTERKNWLEAREHCKAIMPGSDLVSIRNSGENDQVFSYGSPFGGTSLYIGINDLEVEGHMVWAGTGKANAHFSDWYGVPYPWWMLHVGR